MKCIYQNLWLPKTIRGTKKFLATAVLLGSMIPSINAQTYVPIELEGFNDDVIANGIGSATSSTTNDVDGVNFALVSEDFQATASGASPVKFLPENREIIQNDKWFTLADYSENNALRLSSSTPSGTLTFVTPVPATELNLLGVSGSGASDFSVEVTYEDNTTETFDNLSFPDWFATTGVVVAPEVGRVDLTNNNMEAGSGPQLFEVNMVMGNPAENIISLTVTRKTSSLGVINIMAASVLPGITDVCSGVPSAGEVSGPDTFGACMNNSFNILMTGTTMAQGISYNWEGRNAGSSDAWQPVGTSMNLSYPPNAFIVDLEFRLIVTCTNSGEADTSDVITVTVNDLSECYCEPAATNSNYYINNFETTGAIENISNTGTGYSTGGYGDFTAMKVKEEITGDVEFSVDMTGSTFGFRIWVDWNHDGQFDASEVAYNSTNYSSSHEGSFTIPGNALEGETRMRIVCHYLNSSGDVDPCITNFTYGEFEDYTMDVVYPDCPKPADLSVAGSSADSFDITWMEVGSSSTGWNISWGEPGYDPDGNDAIGTDVSSTTSYTIVGLDPDTEYDIYVQSDCDADSLSHWATTSATTECSSVTVPFLQDFEDVTVPAIPHCGTLETNAGNAWKTQAVTNYGFDSQVLSYSYNSATADSWYFTQGIEMEAGVNYVMTYKYGNNSTYNAEKLRVTYGTSPNSVQMLDTIAVHDDISLEGSDIDTVTFSPDADGVYYFGFQVFSAANQYYLYLDDISIDFCDITPGINGAIEVCRLDDVIDLNDVITSEYTHGIWSLPGNQIAVDGSDLYLEGLMSGDYELTYIVSNACTADTTIATVKVFPPSSAGEGSTITVCKNAAINLFDGIVGNADLGGDWYDYNNNLLSTSQAISSNIPGSFNYKYVVSNGVCPADTSIIEVIVDPTCDNGLSVDAENFVELSVHPNPATTYLNIVNPSNISSLNIDMIDMNGRVVLSKHNEMKNASEVTLDISKLERGIYTLRIYNNEGQKTFKVVKQ